MRNGVKWGKVRETRKGTGAGIGTGRGEGEAIPAQGQDLVVVKVMEVVGVVG
jgi:hypothetical protein